MVMVAPIATNMSQPHMITERDVLILAQWLSPGFPVGAFAYSHGLETAIQAGTIGCADELQHWLEDVVAYGSGRNDCILLRAAYASKTEATLIDVNETTLAVSSSKERALETRLQGAAFGATTAAIWGGDTLDLCYPVAVGAAAARMVLDVDLTTAMYLHSFAGNLVSAAVRCVPLGQTDGQMVLAALLPLCDQTAKQTENVTLNELHSTAFLSDIAALKHETLQPRNFRS